MLKSDLRKGVMMMKQLANRGEKTDVMTDELCDLEKKLETFKHIYTISSKKIAGSLQSSPGDSDDKRRKKIAEFTLANTFRELAQTVPSETATYAVLSKCGDVLGGMTEDFVRYQKTVEEKVVNELNALVEVKMVELERKKKEMKDYGAKMDAAKNRFATLLRQAQQNNQQVTSYANPTVGGWGTPQSTDGQTFLGLTSDMNLNAAIYGEEVREAQREATEAEERMERCRDELTLAMRRFCRSEAEHAYSLVQILSAQLELHRRCVEQLESIIPQCTHTIQELTPRPVFGVPLNEHLQQTNRRIAVVIEEGYQILTKRGLTEEGLFRLAASQAKLRRLKVFYDFGKSLEQDSTYEEDVHVIAGVVKQYLRELPEPLLSYALYDDWVRGTSLDDSERVALYRDCVHRLPASNRENLQRLIQLLIRVVQHRDRNKMTEQNVGICIGPNLLWSESARSAAGDSDASILIQVCPIIVETLILFYDRIFDQFANAGFSDQAQAADDSLAEPRPSLVDSKRLGSVPSMLASRNAPQRRPPPPPQTSKPALSETERDRVAPQIQPTLAAESQSSAILIDFDASPAGSGMTYPSTTGPVSVLPSAALNSAGIRLSRSASSNYSSKTAVPARSYIEQPRQAPPPPPSYTYQYQPDKEGHQPQLSLTDNLQEYVNSGVLFGATAEDSSSVQSAECALDTAATASKQQRPPPAPPAPPVRRPSQTHKRTGSSELVLLNDQPSSPTRAIVSAVSTIKPETQYPKAAPPAPPARTYVAMPPPRR